MYPDLANTAAFSAAGVAICQYGINDSVSGIPFGGSGAIAQGQSRGLARYIAIKEATNNIGEPRVVNVTGDNGNFRHQYVFNPADLGLIAMGFGVFSQTAYAAFSGTKIDTLSSSDYNAIGLETNKAANAKQATLLITVDAQDADALNFGQARFVNYFYPAVNVVPLTETMTEVTGAIWNFRGVPTQTSKYPWGVAYTNAINGFTRAKCAQITSKDPMTLQTIVADGSTTVWSLDFSPTEDETGYTTRVVRYQSNGTISYVTPSDINIAAKTITLPSVYTAGDILVVIYSSFDVASN